MPAPAILIVDDDPRLRRMVSRTLAKGGFEPVEAASAADAMSFLRTVPAGLVLLDLLLDKENGWELLQGLRAMTPAPIILMTGASVDADTRRDAALLGAQGVLAKPFEEGELLETVGRVLGPAV